MRPAWLAAIAMTYALAACAPATELTVVGPNQPPESTGQARTLRINGAVGTPNPAPPAQVAYGTPTMIAVGGGGAQDTGRGDISLDFADTDLREVVAQILGAILHVNYTIDPAVHGTATLHTVTPLSRSQLLPALVALLGQNGATLLQAGGIYRVVTTASAATGGLAGSGDAAGGQVLPLRYASAADLARVLQPFVGTGAKIVADPASNVLLVSGEPGERAALAGLVQAFDTDILAGQSYALLPVPEGAAKDFTASLQEAFRAQGNAGLAGIVRVVPLDRINSVLVIAPQGRYIDDARRVYALIERQRRLTVRSWHVYYLQDSNAQDAAYALQQAFTPNAVTATPSTNAGSQTAPGRGIQQASSAGSGAGIGGAGSGIGAGTSLTGGGGGLAGSASAAAPAGGAPPSQTAANPLLGGLDTSGAGGGGGGGGMADTNTMRIIPNPQNNALLIYATQQEEETIEAMLRKIDILPLQVRIDATIAEVTLNDQLQYGTQFFFKSGGVNAILNNTAQTTPVGTVANTVLATTFPGFVIGGPGQGGAPLALQALQAVTTVHVLSSPELLVLDNQTARLQVGDLVPYLTSSSQNTAANSAVINSVNYQPTGVIMNVTPRVNNGGVVTLDISQEVSGIDTTVPITTTGIASPTFSERSVTSRVVVQSGQTIGLAGLITDNISRGNSGIPFLKDIPLLGFLTGTQNNQRTRTELLVLITPHVLYDQRDARALTEDLQQQLPNAAAVPAESQMLRASGSNDPGQSVRRALQLH